MAIKEHLALLRQETKNWNEWRGKNSNIIPDLSGADLSGANLSGANLISADLSWANLISADLSGANLSEANFNGAYLNGANLNGANLNGANLSEANLISADFSWVNLISADLSRTNLSGQNLSGAILRGQNLSGANLISANLRGAILSGTDLSGAILSSADLSGTDLSGAILIRSNLSRTNLSGTDLRGAILSGTDLSGTDLSGRNLSGTDLSGTDLSGANLSGANLSRTDLSRTDLSGANLISADLSGANLISANLSRTDLSGTNLSGTDLTRADLSTARLIRTQALGTNFTAANFTGACLEDWHINSATKLDDIDCQYVYLKSNKQERRPSSHEFAPGEFTKLFQKALSTIDLIFRNGVDWEAFAYSFRKIQVEYAGEELAIESIENKGDGVVVVRVNVSPSANKPKIHSDFKEDYELAHKVLEERYRAELSSKDAEIVHYGKEVQTQKEYINNLFYLLNQQQTVQKAMVENPGKVSHYNLQNSQFAGGLVDAQTVNAHQIGGNITNYTPEQKQNLAEAAAEIQQLLNQLAQTNPTTELVTEAVYQEIKRNPTLKARLLAALKAGGLEALKAIFDNPIFSIPAETIKGWLEAE